MKTKKMKKLMTVILSCLVLFAMSEASFAAPKTLPEAEKYSLTLNKIEGVTEIQIYQLVTIDKVGDHFKYELNPKYKTVFDTLKVNKTSDLEKKTEKDILDALQKNIPSKITPDSTETVSGSETSKTMTNMAGYYYITMKGDSGTIYNPTLVMVPKYVENGSPNYQNQTVDVKSNKPGIDKQVKEGNAWGETANADIGDTVEFKIEAVVPKYAAHVTDKQVTFTVTDKMSKGLTWLTGQAVAVTDQDGMAIDKPFKTEPSAASTQEGTAITFDFDYAKIKDKTKVVLKYKAMLNKDAVMGVADGNQNSAKLTYTTDPHTNTKADSTEDKTKVYTYGLDLTKAELGHPDITLKDAKFQLKKEGNGEYYFLKEGDTYTAISTDKYTFTADGTGFKAEPTNPADGLPQLTGLTKEVVSDAQGKILIKGLDEGTYTLTETQPPKNYYIIDKEISFTISADKTNTLYNGKVTTGGETGNEIGVADASYHKTVFNSTKYVLPNTGDRGALLLILSGIVMLGAACILLLLMRRRSNQNK